MPSFQSNIRRLVKKQENTTNEKYQSKEKVPYMTDLSDKDIKSVSITAVHMFKKVKLKAC